jgi:hypothetical protein
MNATYNSLKSGLMTSDVNLAGTLKVMLVTAAYTPDIDNHAFRSDVTNEVSGTGYTAGGKALTGNGVTVDTAANEAVFDADNVSWASSTITARGAVIYVDTGNAATDRLIHYVDFGGDLSSSNGTFEIAWDADGILALG